MTNSVFCDYRCHPPPGRSSASGGSSSDNDGSKGGERSAFGFCEVAPVLAVGEGGNVQFYGEEVSNGGILVVICPSPLCETKIYTQHPTLNLHTLNEHTKLN